MTERFCKDCKHARIGWLTWLMSLGSYEFAKCARVPLRVPDVDLASGRRGKPTMRWCSVERGGFGQGGCGPDGNLWEPRP